MTDFVLVQKDVLSTYKNHDKGALFERCESYANFLKQPLELWMFVPCDEDNNILVHPYDKIYPASMSFSNQIEDYNLKFKQAKERCLFEGFDFCESQREGIESGLKLFVSPYNGSGKIYLTKKKESGYHSWFQLFTIEDLVQCELILTAN